ncbi:MAG: hypothetical protein EKK48_18975 [Candidatus Melainabacteria bacterium]|nr:MAG: hypothetical protein EKK48_18975 [Candidatus Melainabacteria bacterium]
MRVFAGIVTFFILLAAIAALLVFSGPVIVPRVPEWEVLIFKLALFCTDTVVISYCLLSLEREFYVRGFKS